MSDDEYLEVEQLDEVKLLTASNTKRKRRTVQSHKSVSYEIDFDTILKRNTEENSLQEDPECQDYQYMDAASVIENSGQSKKARTVKPAKVTFESIRAQNETRAVQISAIERMNKSILSATQKENDGQPGCSYTNAKKPTSGLSEIEITIARALTPLNTKLARFGKLLEDNIEQQNSTNKLFKEQLDCQASKTIIAWPIRSLEELNHLEKCLHEDPEARPRLLKIFAENKSSDPDKAMRAILRNLLGRAGRWTYSGKVPNCKKTAKPSNAANELSSIRILEEYINGKYTLENRPFSKLLQNALNAINNAVKKANDRKSRAEGSVQQDVDNSDECTESVGEDDQ